MKEQIRLSESLYAACIGGRMFYWQASGQWSNMGEMTRHDIVAEYKPTTTLS